MIDLIDEHQFIAKIQNLYMKEYFNTEVLDGNIFKFSMYNLIESSVIIDLACTLNTN